MFPSPGPASALRSLPSTLAVLLLPGVVVPGKLNVPPARAELRLPLTVAVFLSPMPAEASLPCQ